MGIDHSTHACAESKGEHYQGEVVIASEVDIVSVRKAVREASVKLGFGVTDVTRIVTAASELARNTYLYASSGRMCWRRISNAGRAAIELVFEDRGPGIADIACAMQEGYTSGGGLGMGLPGTQRLMDEMEITSEPGKGTTVMVRKWRR